MPSGLPIFPLLNGFSVHKKPIFASAAMEFMPGNELTVAQQAFPLWEFDLTYEILRTTTNNQILDQYFADYSTEYESVLVQFLVALGQANYFLFDDLSDDSRTGQFIATGDGVTHVFRLVRTWGVDPTLDMLEPIGELNQSQPFQFYLNGVPAGPGILPNGESIDFGSSPPAAGVTITGDFFFYYKCRFIEDSATFEEILHDRWANKTMKFRSVKTTPQTIQTEALVPLNGYTVQQLEIPAGWILDEMDYNCIAGLGSLVCANFKNSVGQTTGFFWDLAGGQSVAIPFTPPYSQDRFLATFWHARAPNYGGDQVVGGLKAFLSGQILPATWNLDTFLSMGAKTGDLGADCEQWGVSGSAQIGVGRASTADNGGAMRAVYWTISPAAFFHQLGQLQNGKDSIAYCCTSNGGIIYGYDTDHTNLIQAASWDRVSTTETLMNVPGGNTFSAVYCAEEFGDFSGGRVVTGGGAVQAIYWTGTSTHTILPNLGTDVNGICTGISNDGSGTIKCGITGNASGKYRATVWTSDVPAMLPLLPGCDPTVDVTEAWGMTLDGTIIAGTCTIGGLKVPVLWRSV